MNAGTIERIETNVERFAGGLFSAAVAFALLVVLRNMLPPGEAGAAAAAGLVLAYIICAQAMALVTPRKLAFQLRAFDVRELEPIESGELLLTEADRLAGELVLTDADRALPVAPHGEPLLLDDPLPASADSRVVRLFDRRAMPTPGELKSRIDDHLAAPSSPPPQSDAAKALADALAELRRSLR